MVRLMAATDEGAARKYKERSIRQYFALYIIGIFATKKHYYLRMFDLSPLLLWSEEKLCSWAVSPCLRNTQQRRAWRELAKGDNTRIDIFYITLI